MKHISLPHEEILIGHLFSVSHDSTPVPMEIGDHLRDWSINRDSFMMAVSRTLKEDINETTTTRPISIR